MRPIRDFAGRSIRGACAFFMDSVFADEYAARDGFLQRREARAKTAAFLLALVAVLCTRSLPGLAVLYAGVVAAAVCSGIDGWFFLKRTWIFIPLFSLFVALPAVFAAVSPGQAVWTFAPGAPGLAVTRQGLSASGLLVLRVAACASLAVLLALTTRHHALLKALRVFRVSGIFVMTAGMCYRYIYLFAEIVLDTYRALRSRVGGDLHPVAGGHVVAGRLAGVWRRSCHLNEQVYRAMLARGYQGVPQTITEFRTTAADWALLAGAAALCAGVIAGNLAAGGMG